MEERIYIIIRDRERERLRDLYADNNFTKTLIFGYAPKKKTMSTSVTSATKV